MTAKRPVPAEFLEVLAYLQEGARDREPMTAAQAAVYFDLLGDLPMPVLEAAARRVMMEHAYPTVPTPGAIRRAALELVRSETAGPEAWRLVQSAVRGYGLDGVAKALANLPPLVGRAAECFGWRALCDSKDSELTQTRFLKVFEQLAAAERREASLPPTLRAAALRDATPPRGQLPPAVAGIVGSIGRPPAKEAAAP